ncbi:SufB/SufD family protein [Spiroplasma eriocheiris]|uniref:FeS assembly protein SufD n=1 Tax=Spiroplasma eriocheiris TaxID=315358 RepID=A0A0H3XND3_9MOLU|nr:SufD family Fe-S cluster assembly protein [Spiroplasma eriocheiris]AHF58275.1 ABC-type iron-sulfur cluster assembly transport system permease protein [Spiroplasma eriocheiris CCTCC M 207170]AKM54712.1 FeS assembly protein SufD [Spiroplasma eriocheiris]
MSVLLNNTVVNNQFNIIDNSQHQTVKIENTKDGENFEFNITDNIKNLTLLVFLHLNNTVNLKFNIANNTNVNIVNIYKNKDNHQNINLEYNVLANSTLNLYHLNIVDSNINENVTFNLLEKRSKVIYYLASLSTSDKQKNEIIYAHHQAPQTFSEIKTYSIAKDASLQTVKCTSHIEKTMAKSEAHQELRLLVFDKTSRAISDPILLIDENDIKASHANALGMLDPEQVFYLQARGLTVNQARKLICMGYFKHVIEAIDDEKIQTEIINEIDREIGE